MAGKIQCKAASLLCHGLRLSKVYNCLIIVATCFVAWMHRSSGKHNNNTMIVDNSNQLTTCITGCVCIGTLHEYYNLGLYILYWIFLGPFPFRLFFICWYLIPRIKYTFQLFLTAIPSLHSSHCVTKHTHTHTQTHIQTHIHKRAL